MAIHKHHQHGNGHNIWLTPKYIIDSLGEFDLDPCAAPSPRPWDTAKNHYSLPQDGLKLPWFDRIWLNSPYDNIAWIWMEKLADHGNGTALIFARTETKGFVNTVWKRADAIFFFHGRLYFYHSDGTKAKANAGAPSCLVAYGDNNVKSLQNCGLEGTFIDLRK